MSFSNITQEDLVNRGVTGLPDTPNLSTADMQRKFDELALDVVIPKFNKLLEDLASATAAANIGANAPEGMTGETVQALLDSFYTVVQACEGAKHAHENLDVLDSMTTEIYANIDHIIAILGDITNITDTVTGSSTEIPTGKAIAEYIQVLGGGDMLKSIYDPDGDGVVVAAEEAGNAERLGGQLPNYYQSVTADDLETAAKTIVGAINELNGKSVDTYTTMEQVEAATDPTIPVGAGAIKELNESLKWNTLYSFKTWTDTVPTFPTLPSDWKELKILVGFPNAYIVGSSFIKEETDIANVAEVFTNGLSIPCGSDNGYSTLQFKVKDNIFSITDFKYANTSVTTSSGHIKAIGLYYR